MLRHGRRTMGMATVALLVLVWRGPLNAQETPVTADLPVLLTSCGQSPGPTRIQFFLKRLDLQHEFLDMATAQDLADRQAAGNPVKTLIIVTGASLKGMGAAGVSMREELIRTEALIAEAKRQGILIIGPRAPLRGTTPTSSPSTPSCPSPTSSSSDRTETRTGASASSRRPPESPSSSSRRTWRWVTSSAGCSASRDVSQSPESLP
jgi:hypothetical protein